MRPPTVMAMCAPMMLVHLHSLASPRPSSIPKVSSATVKIGTSRTQPSPCPLWTMARSQPRFRKQQPSCAYGQILPT